MWGKVYRRTVFEGFSADEIVTKESVSGWSDLASFSFSLKNGGLHGTINCLFVKLIVNRVIKKPNGDANKMFVQLMEALGYDIELHYVKREELRRGKN